MTTSWQDQYLAALQIRDRREQANKSIYDACTSSFHLLSSDLLISLADTKLADHTSTLTSQAVPSVLPNTNPNATTSAQPPPEIDITALTALRTDLATAQSTRSTLTSELADLTTTLASLQSTLTSTSTTANSLAREKAILERKLRDRDEELKEKGRMLERVQDEVAALEMQLNLLEEEKEGGWGKGGVRRGSAGR